MNEELKTTDSESQEKNVDRKKKEVIVKKTVRRRKINVQEEEESFRTIENNSHDALDSDIDVNVIMSSAEAQKKFAEDLLMLRM